MLLLGGFVSTQAQSLQVPSVILSQVPFQVAWEGFLQASTDNPLKIAGFQGEALLISEPAGEAEVRIQGHTILEFPLNDGSVQQMPVKSIPGWLSLLPPLLAILLALVTREMLLSLFAGIWVGVTVMMNFNPVQGFLKSLDLYIVDSIADPGHATILLFTFGFGGLIGVVQRNGGLAGIVAIAAKFAKTRVRGQVATAAMGLFIFFDDYDVTLQRHMCEEGLGWMMS